MIFFLSFLLMCGMEKKNKKHYNKRFSSDSPQKSALQVQQYVKHVKLLKCKIDFKLKS